MATTWRCLECEAHYDEHFPICASCFRTGAIVPVPRRGPALLVAAEEGLGPTLASRLLRCNVKRADFHVLTRASVDTVVAYAVERKVVTAVVDSVQEGAWTAGELRHLLEVVPTLDLLVSVIQVTKEGLPAGAMALQHECDAHVAAEAMRWRLVKSRYQELAGVGADVQPRAAEAAA